MPMLCQIHYKIFALGHMRTNVPETGVAAEHDF
jgi:hypothetical protein